MKPKRLWLSLIGICVAAIALLGTELAAGNSPALGLDLQGGVSVILEPTEDVATAELETVTGIVRNAVDSLGIAEPDVRREGDTIVVDLPGVKDQSEALALVNVTGKVALRPVVAPCSQAPVQFAPVDGGTGDSTDTSVAGSSSPPTTAAADSPTPDTGTGDAEQAAGWAQSRTPAQGTQPDDGGDTTSTTSTTVAPQNVPGPVVPETTATTAPVSQRDDLQRDDFPIERDDGSVVALTTDDRTCTLGPPGGTGEVFSRDSAEAQFSQRNSAWVVTTSLSGNGQAAWDKLASECYSGAPTCPTRQIAIVLDGVIQTAPVVQQPSFTEGDVQITGMSGEGEARDLAGVINRGAYPFDIKPATVNTVSPELGEDTLFAALVAGAVGIVLVIILMVLYYRSLAMVIVAGLVLTGVITYGVITFLSSQRNLALTLSGAAGLIVSIGITIDSYVVYFERIKDEARQGRSLRNSALKGFNEAWRTIVNGNIAALIGALVLFWLSAGSVRGFALFLALSTAIDLIVMWFFTRPAVLLLAHSGRYDNKPVMGLDPSQLQGRSS